MTIENNKDTSSISHKTGNYSNPTLRETIKKRIMAGSKGGRPGQWSARKAQLVAAEYKKSGGKYVGKKDKPQKSIDKWTKEKWTTIDGGPAIKGSKTRRYLPEKAWKKLTPQQRIATNLKKLKGSSKGNQFVANTEKAQKARKRTIVKSLNTFEEHDKKTIMAARKIRKTDPDVYVSPDSARVRSRQLGCIGIRRYEAVGGGEAWMPCTNESDYRRMQGVGPQAAKDKAKKEREFIRRVIKNKSIIEKYSVKSLDTRFTKPEIDSSVSRVLLSKIRAHNKNIKENKGPKHALADLEMIKAVYSRGGSNRKKRNERVNSFFVMLSSGRPKNIKYIQDVDLLPPGHPWINSVKKTRRTVES